ncbi:MAG: hypothetical protein KDD52_03145 [Bdellovibrionales bacterium]|nr:hypothetical protein [Bdellovibrionales bacterium]
MNHRPKHLITQSLALLIVSSCLWACPTKQSQPKVEEKSTSLPDEIIRLGKTPDKVRHQVSDINKQSEARRKRMMEDIEK